MDKDPQELNQLIKQECLICTDRTKCHKLCNKNHLVCDPCITKYIRHNQTKQCPYCMQPISVAQVEVTVTKHVYNWKNIIAVTNCIILLASTVFTLVLVSKRFIDCKNLPCYCNGSNSLPTDECGSKNHPIQPPCQCTENKWDIGLFVSIMAVVLYGIFNITKVVLNGEREGSNYYKNTVVIGIWFQLTHIAYWIVYYRTSAYAKFLTTWFGITIMWLGGNIVLSKIVESIRWMCDCCPTCCISEVQHSSVRNIVVSLPRQSAPITGDIAPAIPETP